MRIKMEAILERVGRLAGEYFFEVVSLLLAAAALYYAALAFRVAKRALLTSQESDKVTLKLKAQERREQAERSFLSLELACHDMRSQWDVHHGRHFPMLAAKDFRRDDTRHITEIENEGRNLLKPLALSLSELGTLDVVELEKYIQRADQSAVRIERLAFRLSPPKQLFA
jgi:hypothetical protein